MKILFPYMARWHAVNWTRYHSMLIELGKQGHEVHVLQPPPMQSHETNFQEIERRDSPNVHVHDVALNEKFWNKEFPLNKLVKKAYFSMAAYGQAKRMVKELGIDLVLLYNIPQYQFMSLGKQAKVVFDYADDYIDMLSFELGKLDNPIARGLGSAMLESMMTRSDLVLSVSHELAKNALGNVAVLPNGVALSKVEDQLAGIEPPAPNERPVVGFLGAFEYFIDFDAILAAAQRLPAVDFVLIGGGREWQRVKDDAAQRGLKNVSLPGPVPHAEIFQHINRWDICLNVFKKIPVSHRACPIKLFEYMALEKPVISTRLHELVHIDNGDQPIVYYGDHGAELAERVQEILDKPEEAKAMAARGAAAVRDRYTWEGIAHQFADMTGGSATAPAEPAKAA